MANHSVHGTVEVDLGEDDYLNMVAASGMDGTVSNLSDYLRALIRRDIAAKGIK